MSLWDSVRGEVAGAWRSLRYDLGRPPAGPSDPRPDVTFTGMNTFPGSLVSLPVAEPHDDDPAPPRRFVAVAAFCALGLGGAAGSYLVATTTFAGRMTDPVPIAAPVSDHPVEVAEEDAGMGSAPPRQRRHRTVRPAPEVPVTTRPTPTPTSEKTTISDFRTPEKARPAPDESDCDCETPPVPTPTAPSPSDSAGPSPEPDDPEPSASEPSPSTNSDRRHRWAKPEISFM
ncbi:hypothetical protein [Actinoplanes couchii]|uniref:Uncharacterized protein n=1 Tax=Actinoplanes couchii TaxID=403638 RepID=A0ABQ3X326_9ACTN|nr:hypothetical protein [Actinoplanes couchii]MDR6322673.1 hypothetical protein [Actinoplanes couchii]GID52911.1 hypothetical protein Aco03nite_013150 [Actinoplanes couchii]